MDINLMYDSDRGVYLLNGTRVLLLPRGALELIQDTVNIVLGLATKTILEDVMRTTVYSFLTDMVNLKMLKRRGEDKMLNEIFEFFRDIGFGKFDVVSTGLNYYTVGSDRNFNSALSMVKPMNYCYQAYGMLEAIFKVAGRRNTKVDETRCKTSGSADMDTFGVTVTDSREEYQYIASQPYPTEDSKVERVELMETESGPIVNSEPVEIVPVIFFPYLFSKLRSIIGMGAYGIQRNMGASLSKLYSQASLKEISTKYQVNGFYVLPRLAGAGRIDLVKNSIGGLEEIDIYDSFNALHADSLNEKRCFFLSGLLSGLSYPLTGISIKLHETECSSVNNSVCKFSFE